MDDQLLYQIALTMIPEIGAIHAKNLLDKFGLPQDIFKAKKRDLACMEGIGEIRARSIKGFHDFNAAEKEMNFLKKNSIQPLFILSAEYPKRLLHCNDAPILLYYLGNANLNAPHIISIVGTRNNTDYGKQITEQFINELPTEDLLIISGLALGIDAIAHRASIANQIPTIGVLAHGLDKIYPYQHRSLAKEMVSNGGLLTEFRTKTLPDKFHFPKRNRIVAGLSDVTVVIETALKGGSMITANLAFGYHREIVALPGRTTDKKSVGCLDLIKRQTATPFTGTADFLALMGWGEEKRNAYPQRQLFYEPSDDEAVLLALLKDHTAKTIDELNAKSSLSYSTVASALLNLELNQVVIALPGKMYRLLE
jgi:DNA processing protein